MSNIFFKPFVGSTNATGGIFGKRVMVLGESHYCDKKCGNCGNIGTHPECGNFTNRIVKEFYLNKTAKRLETLMEVLEISPTRAGLIEIFARK